MTPNDTVEVVAVIVTTSAAVLTGVIVGIRACSAKCGPTQAPQEAPKSQSPDTAVDRAPTGLCPVGCDLEVTNVALSDDSELTEVLCKTCNKCYEFRHKQLSTEKPV